MKLAINMRLLIVCVFIPCFVRAQNIPYLERQVSLQVSNVPLSEIFKTISQQSGVVFSYTQFNDKRQVTINCNHRPLRLVLNEVLKETGCRYKLKGKYIILKCDKPTPQKTLQGYIYNLKDSTVVQGASVYIRQNKFSTVSNQYGYFKLSYPDEKINLSLTIARENYYDTTLVLYHHLNHEAIIYLYPKPVSRDSISQSNLPLVLADTLSPSLTHDSVMVVTPGYVNDFMKIFSKVNTSFRNIKDTLFSNIALTVVPYLSTNRLLSVNTVNKVSFNILIGYSKGVRAFEFGGLINIDNGDVKYTQIAGLSNIVNGNVKGVQMAGITNLNSGNTNAIQVAGITNANKGFFEGVSIAGISTIGNHGFKGISISGISNLEKEQFTGLQLAGITNIARSNFGLQIAGISNLTDTLHGLQIAGVVNYARKSQGLQVSGLINKSHYMSGMQIGLLNFADTTSGIPVGLLSFVKKGVHQLEVSTDETQFVTVGFRTGVDKFHNIIFGGVNYSGSEIYSSGYGLGTSFKIHPRLLLGADLSSQILFAKNSTAFNANTLNKLQIRLDTKIAPWLTISFGPVLNVQVSDMSDPLFKTNYSRVSPYSLYSKTDQGFNMKMWVGAKLALKFF